MFSVLNRKRMRLSAYPVPHYAPSSSFHTKITLQPLHIMSQAIQHLIQMRFQPLARSLLISVTHLSSLFLSYSPPVLSCILDYILSMIYLSLP